MTCREFEESYWSQYITIEKEYLYTTSYVSLHEDNYKTYSHVFMKLLLEICSELDTVLKYYCSLLAPNKPSENLNQYRDIINEIEPSFHDQKVQINILNHTLVPWQNWNGNDAPYWWTAYNKVKHYRTMTTKVQGDRKPSYKFGNLEYTINAMAALYQVETYAYYKMALDKNNRIQTPIPGSKLFQLVGPQWDNVHFWGDHAFFIDENGVMVTYRSSIF